MSEKKYSRLLLNFAVTLSLASAQQQPASAVEQTANIQAHMLPNGLKILLREDHSLPVVSCTTWYGVGSRSDNTGLTGLSHVVEHMLFQNVGNFRKGELGATIVRNGGQFNGFTSDDFTAFFETVHPSKLDLVLRIEADRMRRATFNAETLKEEVARINSDIDSEAQDPQNGLTREVRAAAFMHHPYRNPTIGWKTDLENITVADVKAFYDRYYHAENATIVLVGDFKPQTALTTIAKYFAAFPKTPHVVSPKISEPPQRSERRVAIHYSGKKDIVELAYHAPSFSDDDAPALVVMEKLLNATYAGRLKKLQEAKVIFSGRSAFELKKDPGLFTVMFNIAPGSMPKLLESWDTLISQLKSQTVPESELHRAKNQAEFAYTMERDGPYKYGFNLGFFESLIGFQASENWTQKLKNVTVADLQRVSKKYLNTENRVVGLLSAPVTPPKPPSTVSPPAGKPPAHQSPSAETAPEAPSQHHYGHGHLTGYKSDDSKLPSAREYDRDRVFAQAGGAISDSPLPESSAEVRSTPQQPPIGNAVRLKVPTYTFGDGAKTLHISSPLPMMSTPTDQPAPNNQTAVPSAQPSNGSQAPGRPSVPGPSQPASPMTSATTEPNGSISGSTNQPSGQLPSPTAQPGQPLSAATTQPLTQPASSEPAQPLAEPTTVPQATTSQPAQHLTEPGSSSIAPPLTQPASSSTAQPRTPPPAFSSTAQPASSSATRVGQPGLSAPATAPIPSAAAAGTPLTRVLKNGIKLVVLEDKLISMVQIAGAVRAGAAFDPPGKTGMADLMGAVLNNGSSKTTKAQLLALQEDLGLIPQAMLHFDSSPDVITFKARCLTRDLSNILHQTAASLSDPAIQDTDIEKAKQDLFGQYRSVSDSSSWMAQQALLRALMPSGSPYFPEDLTQKSNSINNIKTADLSDFHSQLVAPENTTLVLVGDVNIDVASKLVEQAFGAWAHKSGAPKPFPPVTASARKALKVSIPVRDKAKTFVTLGGLLGSPLDPANYTALMLSDCAMCNHPIFSRLAQSFANNPHLLDNSSADLVQSKYTLIGDGVSWSINLPVPPNIVSTAAATVQAELRKFAHTGVTNDEFAEVKRYLLSALAVKQMNSDADAAKSILDGSVHAGGKLLYAEITAKLRAATADSLNKFIRTDLKPDQVSLVVAGTKDTLRSIHGSRTDNSTQNAAPTAPANQ